MRQATRKTVQRTIRLHPRQAEFLRSSRKTVQRTIRLHRRQAEFRHLPALYRGFTGGRGSGKSWVGAYDLIRRAKRDRTYMIGSPTSIMMADITFPTFKALAEDLAVWNPGSLRLTPYPTLTLTTGATIRFRTLDDPDKARGPNLSGVWLDEASLMEREAYDIAIACLREGGEQGWLSATFTPKGLGHWTYEAFATGKPNTQLVRSHTRENPFLPKNFAKTIEDQYPGRLSRQELGGEFLELEGAEWPAELFERILFDDWPDVIWRTKAAALDPSKGKSDASGDYSAFVWGGVDSDLTLWVDADLDATRPVESLSGGRSIVEDALALFRSWGPAGFLIETNGFQEWVSTALMRLSRARGLTVPLYSICSTTPKVSRILTLGVYLAQRRLRIKNTPGGRLLLQQLRDFPVAEHDDGPDALKLFELIADYLIQGRAATNGVQLVRA